MKINWFKQDIKQIYIIILSILEEEKNNYNPLSTYLKQGYWCKDCGNSTYYCKCNDIENDFIESLNFIKIFVERNFSRFHFKELIEILIKHGESNNNMKVFIDVIRNYYEN